jgi:hypothetical protein
LTLVDWATLFFLSVIEATDAIRKRCNLDDYEQLKEGMQAFTNDKEMIKAFMEF